MAWYRTRTDEAGTGGVGIGFMLLVVFVILVVIAIATGVVYFRRTGDTTEIVIDEQRIEATTEKAVEQGKSVLRETGEKLQDLGERNKSEDNHTSGP
jgi:Tfp pilus assembly protein PilX